MCALPRSRGRACYLFICGFAAAKFVSRGFRIEPCIARASLRSLRARSRWRSHRASLARASPSRLARSRIALAPCARFAAGFSHVLHDTSYAIFERWEPLAATEVGRIRALGTFGGDRSRAYMNARKTLVGRPIRRCTMNRWETKTYEGTLRWPHERPAQGICKRELAHWLRELTMRRWCAHAAFCSSA